jgi:hypothetical protein
MAKVHFKCMAELRIKYLFNLQSKRVAKIVKYLAKI